MNVVWVEMYVERDEQSKITKSMACLDNKEHHSQW